MNASLSPIFANVLRACRDEINARFALMRREFPDLEADSFFEFLRACGDPVVRAAEEVSTSKAVETGRAVWEAGLELVARNFIGPKARHPWIAETWQRVFTVSASTLAVEPRRVIGALSNAMHHLSSTRDARPDQWIALMERAAPLANDVASLLRAGQVAAWRSGLAHYRDGALTSAEQLAPPLALAAMGLQGNATEVLDRMRKNVWFDPARPIESGQLVGRAGGFRGFGGPFLSPPVVAFSQGHWIAGGDDEQWIITADAFGATFHRLAGVSISLSSKPDSFTLERVTVPAEYGEVTSVAEHEGTIAATAALTHTVLFFHTGE